MAQGAPWRTLGDLWSHRQPAFGVAVVVERLDLGEEIAGRRQVQAETLRKVPPAAALLAAVAEPGPLFRVPARQRGGDPDAPCRGSAARVPRGAPGEPQGRARSPSARSVRGSSPRGSESPQSRRRGRSLGRPAAAMSRLPVSAGGRVRLVRSPGGGRRRPPAGARRPGAGAPGLVPASLTIRRAPAEIPSGRRRRAPGGPPTRS